MPKKTFSKKNRLSERRQFIRLFGDPSVFRSRFFFAFYKPNDLKCSRLGITLKGKTSSVKRTRLKRIVREWFRLNSSIREKCVDINVVIKLPTTLDEKFFLGLADSLKSWNG